MLDKCQASKQPGPHFAEQTAAGSPPTLGLEALFLLMVLQGASWDLRVALHVCPHCMANAREGKCCTRGCTPF